MPKLGQHNAHNQIINSPSNDPPIGPSINTIQVLASTPYLMHKPSSKQRTRNCRNLIKIPITTTSTNAVKRLLLNILSFNARSIINKIDELTVTIHNHKSDIVMVTERWLSENVPDEVLSIPGFTIGRNDRSTGRGGGVAIYIRDSLPFKIRCDINRPDYECLWITVRPK